MYFCLKIDGMIRILCVDTATDICSVALSEDGVCTDKIEATEERAHARVLTVQIEEILHRNSLATKDLDAIAVSEGPGSYTGLRIGVSAAKGICYTTGMPLIAISTLQILAAAFIEKYGSPSQDALLMPMLDARRMEVYYAHYNVNLEQQVKATPKIIDSDVFNELKKVSEIHIIGSGAEKSKNALDLTNAQYYPEIINKAAYMTKLAQQYFDEGRFVDLAYFEPAYLKPFLATKSKKRLF
ncbi:t(6)A37 threonylcarbamoyladenosine biosynthesis protein [Salinivirga cyanobacteriivorans]|uniref:T(6)A37 threonylcarbamoyladenosine biosynthesis protein n=2 Tax=Salinivirga cyanobacteriivorans TaxID=1307839 RepID=A0A0S2HZ63_9BACT|nr:t(6)A37 threonylcarbamoyladenosine biosynthesis protein [Salinivirga cyanobacteriivorans]